MKKLIKLLATGLYTGFLPKTPGTFGSIAYCVLFLIMIKYLEPTVLLTSLISLVITACGYLVSNLYLKLFSTTEHSDPKEIVIDEWAGMAVALIPIPFAIEPLKYIIVSFILFRLFDITKPRPISNVEKLPGALGIMADDLLAGIFAALISILLIFLQIL
ncbi:MAG: phosphatidylglycerophosphatase A [Bdellovibrionota bacterium]